MVRLFLLDLTLSGSLIVPRWFCLPVFFLKVWKKDIMLFLASVLSFLFWWIFSFILFASWLYLQKLLMFFCFCGSHDRIEIAKNRSLSSYSIAHHSFNDYLCDWLQGHCPFHGSRSRIRSEEYCISPKEPSYIWWAYWISFYIPALVSI